MLHSLPLALSLLTAFALSSCASSSAAPTTPSQAPSQTAATPTATTATPTTASPPPSTSSSPSGGILQSLQEAQTKTVQMQARTIRDAALLLRLQQGSGCPSANDLVRERYLPSARTIEDAWGSLFLVSCAGEELEVRSPGPDKVIRTGDDIIAKDEH